MPRPLGWVIMFAMSGAAARPLVSREAELATLCSALEVAADGRATTVLVAGDAGVGKSRLVAELAAQAGSRGPFYAHIRVQAKVYPASTRRYRRTGARGGCRRPGADLRTPAE